MHRRRRLLRHRSWSCRWLPFLIGLRYWLRVWLLIRYFGLRLVLRLYLLLGRRGRWIAHVAPPWRRLR